MESASLAAAGDGKAPVARHARRTQRITPRSRIAKEEGLLIGGLEIRSLAATDTNT